ncbi:hypothetical protein [uncultured Methanoregula sp.]|uniref:hypothetical protein n=1 Tax=uncultured Methanoregula sp. TaxID=1005933 RepID=UPI002AAABCB2|nr:hypothetical protein [uncultured Methanoregula sp.]
MGEIDSLYKKEGNTILIEIKLSSIVQMFNTFDPAPFHEKELDSEAEKYIVNIVNDFPAKTQFKIIFYLPAELTASEEAKKIAPAIHNHFRYKMLVADQKFRSRFRYGRTAMLIGLGFLAIALFVRFLISSYSSQLIAQLLADTMLIIGWAAMWEPVTILLYELWPVIQLKKTYERISNMALEIRPSK